MGLYKKLDGVTYGYEQANQEGIAFKTSSDLLYGTTYDPEQTTLMNLSPSIDGAAFRLSNGKYIYVLWAKATRDLSEQASASYSFPNRMVTGELYRYEWDFGVTNDVSVQSSLNIDLGATPIFLAEKNSIQQPPLSLFSSDRNEGCSPFNVKFYDESLRADRVLWDFPGGNPSSSIERNPSIEYSTPGIYPVTLTVYNGSGEHSSTYLDFIEVKTIPDAGFTYTVDRNRVHFVTDAGYLDSVNYFWEFGDGYFTGAYEPEHYYFSNGDYEVTLTATNSCGSVTNTQTITIGQAPVAEGSVLLISSCPPHQVRCQDYSALDPENWEWYSPDAEPSYYLGKNPTMNFPDPGNAVIRLVVSNIYGYDTTYFSLQLPEGPTRIVEDHLCNDEFMIINGTRYDENRLNGQERFPSSFGCDSLVLIELSHGRETEVTLERSLCPGEVLHIQGRVYDESRPQGTEIFVGQNSQFCDSIVHINLTYLPWGETNVSQTLCAGESISVNGRRYDEGNPSGREVIPGGSSNGCDSIITVNLGFSPSAEGNYYDDLCEGEVLIIDGITFNESNPSGTIFFSSGSVNGCDSILNVNLTFKDHKEFYFQETLCKGEQIEINGTVYDESRRSGTEFLSAGAGNGCDSIIYIALNFGDFAIATKDVSICPGDFYDLNGMAIGEPGTYKDTIVRSTACDSISIVTIDHYPVPRIFIRDTILSGETYRFGDLELTETGTYVDSLVSQFGCDSLVYLELQVNTMTSTYSAQSDQTVKWHIWPNPLKDHFQVDVFMDKPEVVSFKLIDLNGKVLYSGNLSPESGQTYLRKSFNMAQMPSGIYLIQFQAGDDLVTEKIVKAIRFILLRLLSGQPENSLLTLGFCYLLF